MAKDWGDYRFHPRIFGGGLSMKSPSAANDELRKLADLFWQFHNDRLADPELTEMEPYVQPILDMVAQAERKARLDELHLFSNAMTGKLESSFDAVALSKYGKARLTELERESDD